MADWVSELCHEDPWVPLCNLVNHCLCGGIFPDFWKQSEISPLEKTKCVASASDFRPISLHSDRSSVLARVY